MVTNRRLGGGRYGVMTIKAERDTVVTSKGKTVSLKIIHEEQHQNLIVDTGLSTVEQKYMNL